MVRISIPEEKKDVLGIIGQYMGSILLGIGIGVEIAKGADLYFILISAGSAIYAAATKLRKK